MEALLGRNNAPLGLDRLRRSGGASQAAISGQTISCEAQTSKRGHQHYGAEGAVLENETSGHYSELFCGPATCGPRFGHCSGCCFVSYVDSGRSEGLRGSGHHQRGHFVHHRHRCLHQLGLHHHLQLGNEFMRPSFSKFNTLLGAPLPIYIQIGAVNLFEYLTVINRSTRRTLQYIFVYPSFA